MGLWLRLAPARPARTGPVVDHRRKAAKPRARSIREGTKRTHQCPSLRPGQDRRITINCLPRDPWPAGPRTTVCSLHPARHRQQHCVVYPRRLLSNPCFRAHLQTHARHMGAWACSRAIKRSWIGWITQPSTSRTRSLLRLLCPRQRQCRSALGPNVSRIWNWRYCVSLLFSFSYSAFSINLFWFRVSWSRWQLGHGVVCGHKKRDSVHEQTGVSQSRVVPSQW